MKLMLKIELQSTNVDNFSTILIPGIVKKKYKDYYRFVNRIIMIHPTRLFKVTADNKEVRSLYINLI
jgi:hypothetical protein